MKAVCFFFSQTNNFPWFQSQLHKNHKKMKYFDWVSPKSLALDGQQRKKNIQFNDLTIKCLNNLTRQSSENIGAEHRNGKIFRAETGTCVFPKAQRETGTYCPLMFTYICLLSPTIFHTEEFAGHSHVCGLVHHLTLLVWEWLFLKC